MTLRAFYYEPKHIGISEFASGCLTLKGDTEAVTDPAIADVFILPIDLSHVSQEQLYALPYLRGNERRHVMFSICENPDRTVGIPAMIFRCDNNRHLLEAGETTTSTWPWGSQNYYNPSIAFSYDVCFQGWQGMTDLVHRACASVQKTNLKSYIKINQEFFGFIESRGETEKVEQLRKEYLDSMLASRLLLTPQSHPTGVVRYKFYEAMSAGRIPVLISDYAIPALSEKIDYSRCSLRIAESDVDQTGYILTEWLMKHTDEEIIAMGQYGHQAWAEWLDDDLWEYNWTRLIQERLNSLQGKT